MENLIQKAQQFATKAHKGQFRKDNKTSYVEHCKAVVKLLKGIGVTNQDILAAAWLHDTIEDCGYTKDELEKKFNPNIARIVATLTRDVDRDSYKKRIRDSDYTVQIIKLADVVHNCSDLNPSLPEKTIRRKLEDCKALYFDLAKKICPKFYALLLQYTDKFSVSLI